MAKMNKKLISFEKPQKTSLKMCKTTKGRP